MNWKNSRYSWFAAAGSALVAVAALTACSSSPSSTPTAATASASPGGSYSAEISQFGTCVVQHGVTASSPYTAKALRSALMSTPKSQRHAALTACKHYLGSLASEFGSLGGS